MERFRKTFALRGIDVDPFLAIQRYLEGLPETVVLIDQGQETLEWPRQRGEIGISTNGIHHTQTQRIQNSPLAPTSVSSVVIGDRYGADILGAHLSELKTLFI